MTSWRFTDQEQDASTDLYNNDARLYNLAFGRFVSPEAMLPNPYDPKQLNRHAYYLNNQLVHVDQAGHDLT